MKSLIKAAMVIILCFIAVPALAAPKQGTYEAGGQISAWFPDGDMESVFGASGNFLAYYTDHIAFGGRLEAGFSGDSMFNVVGEARYVFSKMGDITPYVGALVGPAFLSYNSKTYTALKAGGVAGVVTYTDKNWAIFGEVQAGQMFGDETQNFVGFGVGALFSL